MLLIVHFPHSFVLFTLPPNIGMVVLNACTLYLQMRYFICCLNYIEKGPADHYILSLLLEYIYTLCN
jgi:hypothetical protein